MIEKKKHFVWTNWDVEFSEHSKRIFDIINPKKGEKILDAAIGMGRYAVPMAQNGAFVIGIDSSKTMIQNCREKIINMGLDNKISIKSGDLNTRLPFQDNEFDKAVSLGTLIHIPNYNNAIRELIRVTKPNGLIITENSNKYHISPLMEKMRNLFEIIVFRKRFEDVVPIYIRSPKEILHPFIRNKCNIEQTYGFYIILPNSFPYVGTKIGIAQRSKFISYGLMKNEKINKYGAIYIVKARKRVDEI